MRKVRIRSMADIDALPEGEWVEVPDGMRWLVPKGFVRKADREVVIRLPRGATKKLNARPGDVLEAQVSGESIIVTPSRSKRPRGGG